MAFERFLVLVDGLTLAFPIALVADDILQVLVALDIVGPHDIRGILDYLLRNTRLTGYLDGKRRAGLSDGELEEGLHLVAVVEHRTIDYARMILCEVLQILIVGGDDAKGLFLPELFQHGFSDGTSDGGLCTAAELIDKQQTVSVRLFHHLLHVHQMARIGREVVLDTLLVADVDEDMLEDSCGTAIANGDGQTTLEHIL